MAPATLHLQRRCRIHPANVPLSLATVLLALYELCWRAGATGTSGLVVLPDVISNDLGTSTRLELSASGWAEPDTIAAYCISGSCICKFKHGETVKSSSIDVDLSTPDKGHCTVTTDVKRTFAGYPELGFELDIGRSTATYTGTIRLFDLASLNVVPSFPVHDTGTMTVSRGGPTDATTTIFLTVTNNITVADQADFLKTDGAHCRTTDRSGPEPIVTLVAARWVEDPLRSRDAPVWACDIPPITSDREPILDRVVDLSFSTSRTATEDLTLAGSNKFYYLMASPEYTISHVRGATALLVLWDFAICLWNSSNGDCASPNGMEASYSTCAVIWDQQTLEQLGSETICTFLATADSSSGTRLEVTFGSTVVIPTDFVPKSGVIKRAGARYVDLAPAANKPTRVEYRVNSTRLDSHSGSLTIVGPAVVGNCGTDIPLPDVVARTSVSMGPYPPSYRWYVGDTEISATQRLNLKQAADKLPGKSGTITLEMRTATGDTFQAIHTVTFIDGRSFATAHFDGGAEMSIQRNRGFKARCIIDNMGCVPDRAVHDFFLRVQSSGKTTETPGLELNLEPDTLETGVVALSCYQRRSTGDTVELASQILDVRSSPLVAAVIGGEYQRIQANRVTVFQTRWPDPDTIPGISKAASDYSWTWDCPRCGDKIDGLDKTSSVLSGVSLPASELEYVVTVKVTDGSRVAETSIRLEVMDGADASAGSKSGPTAMVIPRSTTPIPQQSGVVVVDAVLRSSDSVTNNFKGLMAWTVSDSSGTFPADSLSVRTPTTYDLASGVVQGQSFSADSEPTAVTTLVVGTEALVAGGQYRFEAAITVPDGLNSTSAAVVHVAFTPGNALAPEDRITISPKSGRPLSTEFEIEAVGFTVDAAVSPITYEFAFSTSKDGLNPVVIIGYDGGYSNFMSGVLLPRGAVAVGVRVYDAEGSATSWVWTAVSVTGSAPSDDDVSATVKEAASASARTSGKVYERLVQVSVATIIQYAGLSAGASAAAFAGSAEAPGTPGLAALKELVQVLESPTDVSLAAKASCISAVNAAVSAISPEPAITDAARLAARVIKATVSGLDASSTVGALNTLSSLLDTTTLESVDVVINGPEPLVADVAAAVEEASKSICTRLEYGEFPSVSSNSLFTIVAWRSAEITEQSIASTTVSLTPEATDAVRRETACASALLDGSDAHASCSGICVWATEVIGDIRDLSGSGERAYQRAIGGALSSPMIIVGASTAGSSRRRAVTAGIDFGMTVQFASIKSGSPHLCRVWDDEREMWGAATHGSSVSDTSSISCSVTIARGSVGLFSYCPAGFVGRGCALECAPGDFGQDCANSESCSGYGIPDHVDGTCLCDSGRGGPICQYACDFYLARRADNTVGLMAQGFGPNCKSLCSCSALGSSTCDPVNGSCRCKAGYTGTSCSIDINDCLPAPCKNGAPCTDLVAGFACDCTGTGFTGPTCEMDIDECLIDTCNNGATCMNGINSFACECAPGFTGTFCESYCPDGKFGAGCTSDCTCSEHGVCHAVTGECACNPGYAGDNCSEHDEDLSWITIAPVVLLLLIGAAAVLFASWKWIKLKYANEIKVDPFGGVNLPDFVAKGAGVKPTAGESGESTGEAVANKDGGTAVLATSAFENTAEAAAATAASVKQRKSLNGNPHQNDSQKTAILPPL